MRLIASLPTRNELGRYLPACIAHLREFCDEIRVLDDRSEDGTFEWLDDQPGVEVTRNTGVSWREHEGKFRQALLNWTLNGDPTHVLAIDADEFVIDGLKLREGLEAEGRCFTLRMCEVWSLDPQLVRTDGGWKPHEVGIAYRAPLDASAPGWQVANRKLAGGRVPVNVQRDQLCGRSVALGVDIAHLGWANPDERVERHRRYAELDGGEFHASAHLDSILWPDERCELEGYPAPLPL